MSPRLQSMVHRLQQSPSPLIKTLGDSQAYLARVPKYSEEIGQHFRQRLARPRLRTIITKPYRKQLSQEVVIPLPLAESLFTYADQLVFARLRKPHDSIPKSQTSQAFSQRLKPYQHKLKAEDFPELQNNLARISRDAASVGLGARPLAGVITDLFDFWPYLPNTSSAFENTMILTTSAFRIIRFTQQLQECLDHHYVEGLAEQAFGPSDKHFYLPDYVRWLQHTVPRMFAAHRQLAVDQLKLMLAH